jgi:hypothetical protein
LREVDDFEPLVGDEHARHDHVELADGQRRNEAVPILGNDRAFDLHAFTKIFRQLHFHAVGLAIGGGEIPRRIGTLRRYGDLLLCRGRRQRRYCEAENQARSR